MNGRNTLACLVVALACTACGKATKEPTSQVVARVNDAEITVSQLGAVLQSKGEDAAAPQVARKAIDALIDEQLLLEEALNNKLDRDPAVMQAIEQAKRQVLVRAYVERMVFPKESISASEQIAYYKQHPALFEKRRVFQVVAYMADEASITDEIKARLANARTPEAVAAAFGAANIPYESQALTCAAEQLPLDALPRFEVARVGDIVELAPQQGRYSMMLVTGIQESPISLEKAQPIIQQYLMNVRNTRAVQEHLKLARATAKIQYFGKVSDLATEQMAGQLREAVAEQQEGYAQKSAAVLD
jgi:peptidyl-prolyl cis-trans isomerase C